MLMSKKREEKLMQSICLELEEEIRRVVEWGCRTVA